MSAMTTQQASSDPPEPAEPTPITKHQPPDRPLGDDYATFRHDLETSMRYWPHIAFSSQETTALFCVHLNSLKEIEQIRRLAQAGQQLNDHEAGSEAEE